MSENIEQTRIGNYGITIFCDGVITFFSITEDSEPYRTRMLVWKKDVGFETRVVIRDPSSDLEFTKPLERSEFPDLNLVRLLQAHPQTLPRDIATQLTALLMLRASG